MPRSRRRKLLTTLQALCIENICKNMDTIWCKDFVDKYYKRSHWRYVLGPFDEITPELCQEVMNELRRTNCLKKHHIYLLLSVYSKAVDFSGCDSEMALAIQLTQERCYLLERLNVSQCMKIPRAALNNLISHTDSLIKIEVANSNVGDDFLSVVAVYCSELRYLDASNTACGDPGVLCLVRNQDLSGKQDDRYGQCLKLVTLKLQGCHGVTDNSVATAIVVLPRLRFLEFQDSISAIALAMRWRCDLQCSFLSLQCSDELLEESDLCEVLLANSNSVESVNLTTFMEMSESTTYSLISLERLKKFYLTNEFGSNTVSFQTLFSPVIEKFGRYLTVLELSQVSGISVPFLRDQCTSLTNLVLLWNTNYIQQHDEAEELLPFFQSLKLVKIFSIEIDPAGVGLEISNISFNDLLSVLRSPGLEEVQLLHCHNLLEETIQLALTHTKYEHMVSLHLERCNRINFDGLRCILEADNPLNKVTLTECKEITRSDFTQYQAMAKKRRWDVQVTWT